MSKTKVTNLEMFNAFIALDTLTIYKLPIKISYGVKKNIEILLRELKPYEDEKAILIDKYGEKDEEGNLKIKDNKYFIPDASIYNKEITELNNIENEVEIFNIPLDALLESNVELSTRELTSIEFLLK